MIESVKLALRIKSSAFDAEINDLIDEAVRDLEISGIVNISLDDALISKAIKTYCKANFGINNKDSEKYQESYESIKNKLALCGDYIE